MCSSSASASASARLECLYVSGDGSEGVRDGTRSDYAVLTEIVVLVVRVEGAQLTRSDRAARQAGVHLDSDSQ